MPVKRKISSHSSELNGTLISKLPKLESNFDAIDLGPQIINTPYASLLQELNDGRETEVKTDAKTIVFWMRMHDLRLKDNRGLSLASEMARTHKQHLIVVHILSPRDFKLHDLGPRRIDFVLRNLAILKDQLAKNHIPLVIDTVERKQISQHIINLCKDWKASHLFANIEYEIDELRRDTRVVNLAKDHHITATFVHDNCVVPPGKILTKEGKPYKIYSQFLKTWAAVIQNEPELLEESPEIKPGDKSIYSDSLYAQLFNSTVPLSIKDFECHDKTRMEELYPAGTKVAEVILYRFLHTKARAIEQITASPIRQGVEQDDTESRIKMYASARDNVATDGTSRLSPYLAAGVISVRQCIREAKKFNGNKWDTSRNTGVGMWTEELAWRDFYQHVLAAFPHVCMRKPFNPKYESIVWEETKEHLLQAWMDGKTGYPIVDAGMRQLKETGYMHNRCRMITAMFLSKDLMMDWRIGEKYFSKQLIDCDFGSNNGGWQWSASTGCDALPYFRIMNPVLQSKKCDPNGEYIRKWVPELKNVTGEAIHEPHVTLSRNKLESMGYVWPIVDHKEARERALRRFKQPGMK